MQSRIKFPATPAFILLLLLLLLSFSPIANASITLEPFLSGLDQPVFVGNARDGSNRLFIVEQPGRIRVLQPGETLPTTLLNIAGRVLCCGEQGLLGLAFHPQFASNRRFFVNYTRAGDGATVIAEYTVSQADPNLADTTERVILTIPQPFPNHNGGMLAFGPDGYLYIGMGDGGSGNDPNNYAQNVNELLGKILRIDVDQFPYASPPTNPFFGATSGRDEIYAVGLRNPWRFSFDRMTGQLYVGDVGQNEREEVDVVTVGGNYGWRVFEGTRCTNVDPSLCAAAGFTAPIAEYNHDFGRCSVTGGYAYRGTASNIAPGAYFYADFCSGEIFLFHGGVAQMILDTSIFVSSFGEDESGELYVVDLGGTVSRMTAPLIAPTLVSVTPAMGLAGSTSSVTLVGTGFTPGVSINAGIGLTTGNIQVTSDTVATASFAIAANAALGPRSVTVATIGGTSGPVSFTVVPLPPTLDEPTLASAAPGSAVNVTVTGSRLINPAISVEGGDVAVSNVTSLDPTSLTATFTVSPAALLGPRVVTVTTSGGASSATFLVGNPVPTVTSVTPEIGARGTSVNVQLKGTGFAPGTTSIGALPTGITVRDATVVSFTRLTAIFDIASVADLGNRQISVTTAGGTSESVIFTVANPFPDLEIVGAHNGTFAAGFDETYSITIRNLGGMPTTGAITVNDTLPDGLTFVSAAGAGWSCSAAGSNLSCTNPSLLAPDETTSFTLTVAVDSSAAPGVTHTVRVSTAGDLSLSNNTHSENTPVLAVPVPTFVFTPPSPAAGQQAALALTVDPPFPHRITGTLRLKFSPDPAVGVDDPAIQFETGGRDLTFEVQANASEASFTGAAQAGMMRFQTGTIAGSLGFDGTLKAGKLDGTFSSTGLSALTIPPQPPALQSVQTSSTGGFAALITSFSTGRTITQLSLDFQTAVPVTLSCGTTQGCSTSGSRITLNVASLFADWFADNTMYGSVSTLRLPLSIGGVVPGTVSVTLRNERGASNSLSFPLP
jgi:uncharacterized repeat protein (TIGR01451 family)